MDLQCSSPNRGSLSLAASVSLMLVAMLGVYGPSVYRLYFAEGQSLGGNTSSILLLVALFLFLYGLPRQLSRPAPSQPWLGWSLAALALLMYVVGNLLLLPMLTVGALIPFLAAIVCLQLGLPACRALLLPLLLLLFVIPLPYVITDVIVQPMKQLISIAAENILYWLGYPVARSGVLLTLGGYQLLVADACSGINSLFSLEAIALLYLNAVKRESGWRNLIIAVLIFPISMLANTLRVLILALMTYHLGNDVAQGFMHEASGLLLFALALFVIISLDSLLDRWFKSQPQSTQDGEPVPHNSDAAAAVSSTVVASVQRWPSAMVFSALLLITAGTSHLFIANRTLLAQTHRLDLATLVPTQFADWQQLPVTNSQTILPETQAALDTLYDQQLVRTYSNGQGQQIMLSIAYGQDQSNDVSQVHRPEICYVGQGFVIKQAEPLTLTLDGQRVIAKKMVTEQGARHEPLIYWMLVGDKTVHAGWQRKLLQLSYAAQGVIPDGLLFRVSSIDPEDNRAFALQESFIRDLLAAIPASQRHLLIGQGHVR
ncbi:exosortase-associated protein EpsI, B-type [Pseudaeromonas paramecii]|uniref:Methanolan biosynthesis EpsI domain-containing protein n=1 Tax=Pseudaeromonas paramecii TaxID=2138166 RepID=A0ABP8PUG4_9GAMM